MLAAYDDRRVLTLCDPELDESEWAATLGECVSPSTLRTSGLRLFMPSFEIRQGGKPRGSDGHSAGFPTHASGAGSTFHAF
jgi:hypothetical protein